MRILVLGGSRFLGKTFIETALEQNHEITIFNRGTNNVHLKDVEILTGDRNGDLHNLKGRRWDAVLDTSGLAPFTVRNTTQLLKDSVEQYTFISSISVYKDWVPDHITEDYPIQQLSIEKADQLTIGKTNIPMEHYGAFKALSELEAEKNMPGRVLNIRAGQLVGPYDYTDRLPYWVDRVASGGTILAPGNPNRNVQLIDNVDLSKWILSMMEQRKAGTFNSTGPHYSLTMAQLLESCKQVMNSDAVFEWVDEGFLQENKVAPWVELPLWIPESYPLNEGDQPWKGTFTISIEKAVSSGLTFRPLEETLKDVYNWLVQRNETTFEWKAGMTNDRERELLNKWRSIRA